jgi:hypothetical protein
MLKIKTVSRRKGLSGLDVRVLIFQNGKLVAYVIAEVEHRLFGNPDNIKFTKIYLNKKNKKPR